MAIKDIFDKMLNNVNTKEIDPVLKGINDIDKFNKLYTNSKRFKKLTKKGNDKLYEERKNVVNMFDTNKDIIRDEQIGSYAGVDEDTGRPKIFLNSDIGDWGDYEMINAHEFGHIPYNTGNLPMTKKQNKNIEKRNYELSKPENQKYLNYPVSEYGEVIGTPLSEKGAEKVNQVYHDISPQETRADLFQLRYQLYKDGIYDSSKDKKFTNKNLNEYLIREKEGNSQWNRLLRLYKPKDIKWLLNNIAQNNETNNNIENMYNDLSKMV